MTKAQPYWAHQCGSAAGSTPCSPVFKGITGVTLLLESYTPVRPGVGFLVTLPVWSHAVLEALPLVVSKDETDGKFWIELWFYESRMTTSALSHTESLWPLRRFCRNRTLAITGRYNHQIYSFEIHRAAITFVTSIKFSFFIFFLGATVYSFNVLDKNQYWLIFSLVLTMNSNGKKISWVT